MIRDLVAIRHTSTPHRVSQVDPSRCQFAIQSPFLKHHAAINMNPATAPTCSCANSTFLLYSLFPILSMPSRILGRHFASSYLAYFTTTFCLPKNLAGRDLLFHSFLPTYDLTIIRLATIPEHRDTCSRIPDTPPRPKSACDRQRR